MSELTPSFEELQAIYKPWWNTSSGLESAFPGIEKSRGWVAFKAEYDKREKQEIRLRETARAGWQGVSSVLIELQDLAEIAAGKNPEFRCQEHRGLDTVEAGRMLGNRILNLLSPDGWESFHECAEALKKKAKNTNPNFKGNKSIVSELVFSFIKFLEREKKIPSKKELKIETNRVEHGLSEGDPEWNVSRWDDSTASPYLEEAGFLSLPKASPERSWGG